MSVEKPWCVLDSPHATEIFRLVNPCQQRQYSDYRQQHVDDDEVDEENTSDGCQAVPSGEGENREEVQRKGKDGDDDQATDDQWLKLRRFIMC